MKVFVMYGFLRAEAGDPGMALDWVGGATSQQQGYQ